MPNPIATFDSSEGTFQAEIFIDLMPVTSANFIALALDGFYEGLTVHRAIKVTRKQKINLFDRPI